MNIIQTIIKKFITIKNWYLTRTLFKKIFILIVLLTLLGFIFFKWKNNKHQPQYQTATATKGTLIVSISASGQVSTANNTSVSSQASGVVKKVFVQNDTTVKTNDPLVEIELDQQSQQKYTQALASYQSAQNTLALAQLTAFTLQSDMLSKWDTFKNLAQSGMYQNGDGTPRTDQRALPEFMISQDNWLASEAKYKAQQNVITQAQTAVSSAWLSLQQVAPTIYAPISGRVIGLSLQTGSVIATTTPSSSSTTSQKIASIIADAPTTIAINVTQIDAPKIKIGNKATITMDAFPGKTYTGKVVSIDTVGTVSSGVTTYPTVIALDTQNSELFPNMSAQANIIVETKDNVLLVSTSSIQLQNGQSTIRVLKNKQFTQVPVDVGLSSDTQTEIVSGISEGDTIVTSITNPAVNARPGGQTQSPFSPFGGRGFGGGQLRGPR